jgi:hypothetical protein
LMNYGITVTAQLPVARLVTSPANFSALPP